MGKKNLAPIVLFTYKRLEHTKKVIDSLKNNKLAKESDLFIYSDGAKVGEEKEIEELRKYLDEITGFGKVTIIKRESNWGLAKSVISGVTEIVNLYGKIIVLEDDLVCSPNFLEYMNFVLDKYKNSENVYSVSGYSYIEKNQASDIPDTYFLKIICSWSWGTWKDKWKIFDAEAKGYEIVKKDKALRKIFNYDDACDFYNMLINQMEKNKIWNQIKRIIYRKKKIDSWAIRWYWSVFKQGGLTLYPKETLVNNIGYDGSGTHCNNRGNDNNERKVWEMTVKDLRYEDEIVEKEWIRQRIQESLRR